MEKVLYGKLVEEGLAKWRIIFHNSVYVRGIAVSDSNGNEVSSIIFKDWRTDDFLKAIFTKTYRYVDEEKDFPNINLHSEASESVKDVYERSVQFVKEIVKHYGPTYTELVTRKTKPKFNALMEHFKLNKQQAWRAIRRYLQSGFDESSVIDKRATKDKTGTRVGSYTNKPGRKSKDGIETGKNLTSEDIENMKAAFEYLIKSDSISKRDAYIWMLNKYYVDDDGNYSQFFPSERQFRSQLERTYSKEEYDKKRLGEMEFRNNRRLLLSSPVNPSLRVGRQLEVDECELSIEIVSSADKTTPIGKAVVYFLVDKKTHLIVSMSVHLHNNSLAGIRALLLNHFEKRELFCKRYNMTMKDPSLWPEGFIPEEIFSDQGAEYTSEILPEICAELGITTKVVPKGTGSYKGTVERCHGSLITFLIPEMEAFGLIKKKYDSKHKETAALTLYDVTRLVINFVLTHNNSVVDKLEISREMIMKGIKPVPAVIWNYFIEESGGPTPVTDSNRASLMYKCFIESEAYISRQGIKYKGHYYTTYDLEMRRRMYNSKSTAFENKINVRVDPRNLNEIYTMNSNGDIVVLVENMDKDQDSYLNIVLDELCLERDLFNSIIRTAKREKTSIMASSKRVSQTIIDQANVSPYKANVGNTKEERIKEREMVDKKLSLSKRLEEDKMASFCNQETKMIEDEEDIIEVVCEAIDDVSNESQKASESFAPNDKPKEAPPKGNPFALAMGRSQKIKK